MGVKTGTAVGDYLSPHIKDTEWKCKNGASTILYSEEELAMLEKLRAYVGGTIKINSGYRTNHYNLYEMQPAGAKNSQHIKGTAADVVVKKDGAVIPAKLICCLAQTLGFKGIGYISTNAVHLDMRESGTYRGDERSGYGGNVGNDFYAYFGVNMAQITALKTTSVTVNTCENNTEDEEMTKEQFKEMMDEYLTDLKTEEPSEWSKEERAWAEENGIIVGDTNGQKEYKAPCTREQMVTFLYRFKNKFVK